MNKRSPFLNLKNKEFAIQCFSTLKHLDSNHNLDHYLYNHIVSYALYNSEIHTLGTASKEGNLPVVKYLIEHGIERLLYSEQFYSACRKGHLKVVKYFVEKNYYKTIGAWNGVQEAAKFGHLNVIKYLVKKGAQVRDVCAFTLAAQYGHLEVVKFIVETGKVDIHYNNDFALRYAAENGHLDVIKYLVERGANPFAPILMGHHWRPKNQAEVIKYLEEQRSSYFK